MSSKIPQSSSRIDVEYVADKVVGHEGSPFDRRYFTRCYELVSEDDTVKPAHRIPQHISTRY